MESASFFNYIVYRQQWIIKKLFSQFLLCRLWHGLEGYYSNSRISRSFSYTTVSSSSTWGTFSCRRSNLGCFRIWLIRCSRRVCTWQVDSWVLDQPNYWWLGGWSSSCFWTTLHPVTQFLDLILFMRWEMLDPRQARFEIRKLRQIGSNQRMLDSYWPLSGCWIFLCNKALGATFRFLLSSEGASSFEVGGMQYHVL